MSKKIYGSKSRREKEAQEFKEKISLREETDDILLLIQQKKKEIDIEKQRIATLFIESNTKQSLLKDYISYINKRIFAGSADIDKNIESKAESIEKAIVDLQSKMQIVIKYTKSEMDHQITQKFRDAEKRQRLKMLNKIEEGNNIIRNLNHMRLELEQLKIEFEEMNTKCEGYIQKNEKLRIRLNDQKSDNKNLQKKLKEIQKENEDLEIKYKKLPHEDINEKEGDENNESSYEIKDFNNNNNNSLTKDNKSKEEKEEHESHKNEEEIKENSNNEHINNNRNEEIKNNVSYNNEEKKNQDNINNNNNNQIKNDNDKMPEEYYPSNLIVILKESIKAFHQDINELTVRITDEKKERNEASQLLQKCIDDINSEIKNLMRNTLLPNIKPNYLTYGYNNNINSANKDKVNELEIKLTIFTYIYDNIFQNTKNKNLFYITKENPKSFSKAGLKKKKIFNRTNYY